jgi:hypothetical protein
MEPTSMKIPPDIRAKIIPSQNLSVSDFLNFPLPDPPVSRSLSPQPLQNYLSRLTPNISNVEDIILLPIPCEALLKNLIKLSEISQSESFICEPLHGCTELRMPLWTIEYWLEVLQIHPVKVLWASAQRNLEFLQNEQLTDNTMDSILKQVSSVLSKLSWKDKIKGFPVKIPLEDLTSYLTQKWLSDEHENQMLHLLQKEVHQEKFTLLHSSISAL